MIIERKFDQYLREINLVLKIKGRPERCRAGKVGRELSDSDMSSLICGFSDRYPSDVIVDLDAVNFLYPYMEEKDIRTMIEKEVFRLLDRTRKGIHVTYSQQWT